MAQDRTKQREEFQERFTDRYGPRSSELSPCFPRVVLTEPTKLQIQSLVRFVASLTVAHAPYSRQY